MVGGSAGAAAQKGSARPRGAGGGEQRALEARAASAEVSNTVVPEPELRDGPSASRPSDHIVPVTGARCWAPHGRDAGRRMPRQARPDSADFGSLGGHDRFV